MSERFDDLPILAELGDALDGAFRRQERRPSRWQRLLALFGVRGAGVLIILAVGLGGTAATAALVALRATVITPPRAQDLSPTMRAVAGTSRVAAIRAADPDGAPAWTVRTSRGATGLTCSTAGQIEDGRFGIVGLDGRFRLLPERIVDGCGTPVAGRATLLGARVFDADRSARVRTVISGLAGPSLRAVRLDTLGESRELEVAEGGVFVAVLRGYPEDSAPQLTLRFADGSVQRRRFGADPGVVRDPQGGPALQGELNSLSGTPQRCVRFFGARVGGNAPSGPNACVIPRGGDVFFAARRMRSGERGVSIFGWAWKDNPPRTIVWGWVRPRGRIMLLGAGAPRELTRQRLDVVLAILPAAIDPAKLRLELTAPDGAVRTVRAGQGTVPPPSMRRMGRRP